MGRSCASAGNPECSVHVMSEESLERIRQLIEEEDSPEVLRALLLKTCEENKRLTNLVKEIEEEKLEPSRSSSTSKTRSRRSAESFSDASAKSGTNLTRRRNERGRLKRQGSSRKLPSRCRRRRSRRRISGGRSPKIAFPTL